MRYFTVKYWDRELRRGKEMQFETREEALRYVMVLDPHFRVHIEEHNDAMGG